MTVLDAQKSDFGLVDFLFQRMTFDGQDSLRLLIQQFGQIRTFEINIFFAVSGMVKAINAFEKDCQTTNDNLMNLKKLAIYIQTQIALLEIKESLTSHSNANKKCGKEIKTWLILEDSNDFDENEDLLRYVGAYVCLLLLNYKLPKQIENTLFRLVKDGKEFLNDKEKKDLARLLNKAHEEFKSTEKSFSDRVRSYYFFRNYYASAKERQSVTDWKGMTKAEYLNSTIQIYEEVRNENPNAIVQAFAVVLGLPIHLLMLVPFLSGYLDDWIIVIDSDRGLILFDMDSIFPGGAKPQKEVNSYEQSSGIVVKPLPNFLSDALKKLLLQNSNAMNLEALIGNTDSLNDRKKVTKLLNSTAKISIDLCHMDPFDAALVSGDFRGISTAKTYYKCTTRQSIWDSSNRFYQYIGWGECVAFVDGLDFGSRVVVKDEILAQVFINLSLNLNSLRSSNHCGPEILLKFHNAFCTYSATFAILCLALRNANPIGLLASDFDEKRRYVIIDDKHTLGAASAMPVAISVSLGIQLTYWRAHCAALLMRLQKLNYKDRKLISLLKGVVEQKNTPLFVMAEHPYAASVSSVASYWSVALIPNFARHFWVSKFPQVGISSRFSGGQVRHQSSGNLSWASDSDFVLVNFIKAISVAQEKVLQELEIAPIHGLSRRQ